MGGDGLGWIPDELLVDVPRTVGEELLDAEVAVVKELGVGDLAVAGHFLVEDAPAEAVVTHRGDRVPLRPADGAVLGVVFHRPFARVGEHLGLIAVGVVFRLEGIDGGTLVESKYRHSFLSD